MQRFGTGLAMLAITATVLGGCASGPLSPRESGTLTGAAVGAASGAAIGSASGDAGTGALIGGAVGAITGAIVGDSVQAQQQRQARDAELARQLQAQNLQATSTDRGVVVTIPDVLFAFGRSELTPDSRSKISTIASVVNSPAVQWRQLSIEGHTDSVGSAEANVRLSEARARAVSDALTGLGVAPQRMSLRALGEAYPVAPNVTGDGRDFPAGRARNRRVEVIILSETAVQPQAVQPVYQGAPVVVQPGYPQYPQPPYYPPYGTVPAAPAPVYAPAPGYPAGPPPYGY